jgi:hypothetical protein
MDYSGQRKRGPGRLRPDFRAVIKANGVVVGEAGSFRIADWIASVFDDAETVRPRAPSGVHALYSKYQVFEDLIGHAVIARVEFADAPPILRTRDEEFARRVADTLNRIDPAKPMPTRRVP